MEKLEMCSPEKGYLLIKITVPELNIHKCLQFPKDQLVWDVKQQCLASLPKELKESFNYGLFSPPENGRAGKFLDEERRLGDYAFNGPVGYLELKYKRRVYKMLNIDEKQLKSQNAKGNLRRFLDYVHNGHVEKVSKMCSKGLDPNFYCQETGETPLCVATGVKKPSKLLMTLVNGGALLDYRSKDGSTALHRAIEHRSLEAMKTLLELGASPNYRDGKGLTPVYLTVMHQVDPQFTEVLLHDHATPGAMDLQGWQEVHQACKSGLLQHLEHLLFYGADMNARNASGNTPLHVCAVNGQDACSRQLLFRGADRHALNYANQTACQVAVIAGNMDLAEAIQNYRHEDVVPFRGPPSYNPKRRSAIGWLNRVSCVNTLASPPSPCPSDRSSVPYSSASSSISDGSSGIPPGHETDNASIVTVLALGVSEKNLGDTSDIVSDSSGVGTANSDTTNCSLSMMGTTVVCVEPYNNSTDGDHLNINVGDIIEVTGATDDGFLDGTLRSAGGGTQRSGLFPASCVQEVRLRNHNFHTQVVVAAREPIQQSLQATIKNTSSRIVGRREVTSQHFATAPRLKKFSGSFGEPRTVVLHRGRKGFGFILRGAKATSPLMELIPSDKCPALQYLDDVDVGGVADMAGLKKGDFLLEINGEDVAAASHEYVVSLIRKSGDLVQMTVVAVGAANQASLPSSKSTLQMGDLTAESTPTCNAAARQYATLPRKIGVGVRSSQAPMPPRRDPKTTLSVSKGRAKSMVASSAMMCEEVGSDTRSSTSSEAAQKLFGGNQSRTTASIKQRPTSNRITPTELEELFHQQKEANAPMMSSSKFQAAANNSSNSSTAKNKVYASVAAMKRTKGKHPGKVRFMGILPTTELRRTFHSTPDLAHELSSSDTGTDKIHHSQEDLTGTLNRNLPPPTHPPPPPPPPLPGTSLQLVKVDSAPKSTSKYAKSSSSIDAANKVASSFKPTASAKLYASPADIKAVVYRQKSISSNTNTLQGSKTQLSKSHSLRSTFSSGQTTTNATACTDSSCSRDSSNPYAQPCKALRSHSITGLKEKRHRNSNVAYNNGLCQSDGPLIPDPDYSCSDSDGDRYEINASKSLNRVNASNTGENSGNSNTSGSNNSSCSGSIPHSFSVEEIQRGRARLKSSKSYPDDFLKKANNNKVNNDAEAEEEEQDAAAEDGDNSSSGVSSDQESAIIGVNIRDYNTETNHTSISSMKSSGSSASSSNSSSSCSYSNGGSHFRMGAGTFASRNHANSGGVLSSRHAVSLVQLPPPQESDSDDDKDELYLLPPPPPPDFEPGASVTDSNGMEAVLAPPPQFSDSRQVTRVRIVGTVPKPSMPTTKCKSIGGRLHNP